MQTAPTLRRLLGCNVYISEGRNLQLIRRLEAICSQQPKAVVLAHTFIDEPYNRTGFTLASASIPELTQTISAVAQHALANIDLTAHHAQHPRLGVLDHVSIHPLDPDASLAAAAQAAAAIGQQLSQSPLQLPVYFYGAAHPEHRRLADIRRQLGYFKPTGAAAAAAASLSFNGPDSSSSSSRSPEAWSGSLRQLELSGYPPDAGPHTAAATAGVVTVGAVPWVTNFNVPLYTDDMAAAKAIARAVSTKGGGLPGVEAMALPHAPGVIEVATNLIAFDWRKACSTETVPPGSPTSTHTASHQMAESSGRSKAHGDDDSPALGGGSCSSSTTTQQVDGDGSGQLTGAGPLQVSAAVAQQAARLGLPPPGPGYVTNKTPAELIAVAARQLQFP